MDTKTRKRVAAHTPERIGRPQADAEYGRVLLSAGRPGDWRGVIAWCDAGDYARSREEGEANARRIEAAWNAARDANLSTEALEAGVVKQALAALEEARDELRLLGRDLQEITDGDRLHPTALLDPETMERVEAALAAARGS